MLQFGLRLHNYDSWEITKRSAILAEKMGFDSLWLNDHVLQPAGPTDEKFREAWSSLAGLAALTKKLKVGTLVACNGFRSPPLLAKMAATLDVLSGGRLILGMGAGWFEEEYRSYGIPFRTRGERMQMLEESVKIIRTMLEDGRAIFNGKYYHLDNALSNPVSKPRPPIWIGGAGNRLLGIAARLGDGWNCYRMPVDEFRAKKRIFDEKRRRTNRKDPQVISFVTDGIVARTQRRVGVLARRAARAMGVDPERYRRLAPSIVIGTASEAAGRIREFQEAGVQHLILNFPALEESNLEYFGEEVLPQFR